MASPFSDYYWLEEFQVTEADLVRVADHIRETNQAHNLTTLARRVVRGRLRYGPETSVPAPSTRADDPSVRLWDPAKKWTTGDQVIVAVSSLQGNRTTYALFVGEIANVEANTINVRIDTLRKTISYRSRAEYGKDDLQKWRRLVEKLVEARRGARDLEAQVEFVILQHGERVISQLLDTLKADDRFVRLAGRWFLRQLAMSPTEEQLNALAWAMVPLEKPRPTAKLVPLVAPPLTDGDPGLFGLYLAMRHHPDLFENVDPGQRPRDVAG